MVVGEEAGDAGVDGIFLLRGVDLCLGGELSSSWVKVSGVSFSASCLRFDARDLFRFSADDGVSRGERSASSVTES